MGSYDTVLKSTFKEKTCELPVVSSLARRVPMVLRACLRQRRRWLHPSRIFKCVLHQSESTCATVFSAKFQCKDASGIHDTSLLINMECDADIRKNSCAKFMPPGGATMFQGTVERVTKGNDGVGSIHDEDQSSCSTPI